mmetsp:Transcript_2073/g.7845  ORF Transcript_2073/g.7845 Transcript_2073/m.7845 type:complete len:203 (+) Transcript_2073:186-794(+)
MSSPSSATSNRRRSARFPPPGVRGTRRARTRASSSRRKWTIASVCLIITLWALGKRGVVRSTPRYPRTPTCSSRERRTSGTRTDRCAPTWTDTTRSSEPRGRDKAIVPGSSSETIPPASWRTRGRSRRGCTGRSRTPWRRAGRRVRRYRRLFHTGRRPGRPRNGADASTATPKITSSAAGQKPRRPIRRGRIRGDTRCPCRT